MGATRARSERVKSENATGGKARTRRGRCFLMLWGRMVLALLSRLVVVVRMDDGALELPALLVPASLSRLVVLLVRIDDGARELPALLVPGLLVPLLVVSALLDALESLASSWDLEYMPLLLVSALLDGLESLSLASVCDLEYMAWRDSWCCRSFE